MSVTYGILAGLSVLLLVGYIFLVKNKEPWLLFLYCCVPIVNVGYLMLSLSQNKEFAFFSNGVAYFGSVFLSLCMFMVIRSLCGFTNKNSLSLSLIAVALLMFATVCSPWYYNQSASTFSVEEGLCKVYGPLHNVYALYLAGYFIAMIATVLHSLRIKKVTSHKHAVLIIGIVLGNIAFWLIEKFVELDFEFLAISYLFSEIILLGLYWMMQDYVHVSAISPKDKTEELIKTLPDGVSLHPREREILSAILKNQKRKDIAKQLNLSENTVKTYTRSLYKKLGVTSRDELNSLL